VSDALIEPQLSDEAFLADVTAAGREAPDRVHLWWLGQSGFLIQHAGRHLLFDPYLSDSLTEKYANTAKPHARMTRRVVAPEKLDFVDVVTSTHNHTDHLDGETLKPLAAAVHDAGRSPLPLILPAANEAFAIERLGKDCPVTTIPMIAGGHCVVAGMQFHAVRAAHDKLTRDEQGRDVYLGFVVNIGGRVIYHSGDGVVYEGMAEQLKPFKIDVAILPINGQVGNMNGVDAARLANAIGARLVIPCHYEMFAFNTASPDQFAQECRQLNQECRVLRAGERMTIPR
jgi:L-ascorbate metabolism protein UlaG (beta-lactamase superfamily)